MAPRRPDAREFALTYRVLLARASKGVEIDLSLAAFDFEREVLERATAYEFEPGVHLRFFAELKEDPDLGRAFEEELRNARRHAGGDS